MNRVELGVNDGILRLREDIMQTAKQEVTELLNHLPDESTLEDIQYHLYVLEKIKRGQDDIDNGRSYSHQEAKEKLSRWLNV